MDTIASRYASALLELAIENDKVTSYQSQIKYVLNVFKEKQTFSNSKLFNSFCRYCNKSKLFVFMHIYTFK